MPCLEPLRSCNETARVHHAFLAAAVTWPQALVSSGERRNFNSSAFSANEAWPSDSIGLRNELAGAGLHWGSKTSISIYRFAEGQADRYPALAAELVRVPVDVIVTWGTPASLAAKDATSDDSDYHRPVGTLSPWVSFQVFHIRAAMLPAFSTQAADLEGKRLELDRRTAWPFFALLSCFRIQQIPIASSLQVESGAARCSRLACADSM